MRCVIAGLGVQGRKRRAIAGDEVVAVVDPVQPAADYREIRDVPLQAYDAALVCTPDDPKIDLLAHLLDNGKHVLVEKPLVSIAEGDLARIAASSSKTGAVCYTAYNHRFEPHIARMKAVLDSGVLGALYCVRLFYGNGTARDVRDSPWRDRGSGVIADLGSHLLDMLMFWFGDIDETLRVRAAHRFENRAFDHATMANDRLPAIDLEVSLVSWRNRFEADFYGEQGSAHIRSLCKWGPSTFTTARRKYPSGAPDEETVSLVQPDPTWALEYDHFKALCAAGAENDLTRDIAIDAALRRFGAEALAEAGG